MFHLFSAKPSNDVFNYPKSWFLLLKGEFWTQVFLGISNIVGGKAALVKQYPYQVFMRTISLKGIVRVNSGVLITDRHVLTAAHCMYDINYAVLVFGTIHPKSSSGTAVDYINRNDVVVHPDFDKSLMQNDIAIVKLSRSLPLTGKVKVIRLPKTGKSSSRYYEGKSGIVTGWGHTSYGSVTSAEVLQAAKVKMMKHADAENYYRQAGYSLTAGQLCSNFKFTNSGTAPGDSGGPLLIKEKDGKPTLVGITSFGHRSCIENAPSVYTNVAKFLPWIAKESGLKTRKRF